VIIRLATPLDVDSIAQLHVRAWQAAYRGLLPDALLANLTPEKRLPIWTSAVVNPAACVLLAMSESNELLGFCSLLPSRDPDATDGTAEVTALYVDPNVWRSGVGGALIDAAVESASARGDSTLTLWVLSENTRARAFYEARDFQADGHTKLASIGGVPAPETRYCRRWPSTSNTPQ
jgi:GNAT superfamily N-acetyltransferase